MSTTNTEIAKTDTAPSGLALGKPTPQLLAQVYDAIIEGELPPEIGDPEITAKAIQRRLAAGTLDESLSPRDSLPSLQEEADLPKPDGKGKMSRPLVIMGFHLNPSSFEDQETGEKRGVYAVVDVVDPATGERDAYSCGGGNLLVQLVKAWEEGRYPLTAVVEVTPTGTPGRKTIYLRRATAGEESTAKSAAK